VFRLSEYNRRTQNAELQMQEIIMKIVVIGGTGLIGSKLVPKLREHGHEAIAASPDTGVNTITGEGLEEALKGASWWSTYRTPLPGKTRL
jgi:glutamate dehydrogenase/leucine dehydrogenase